MTTPSRLVRVEVNIDIPWKEWSDTLAAAADILDDLPAVVKELREYAKLSRATFCENLDIKESRLQSIETGVGNPASVDEAIELLDTLIAQFEPTLFDAVPDDDADVEVTDEDDGPAEPEADEVF